MQFVWSYKFVAMRFTWFAGRQLLEKKNFFSPERKAEMERQMTQLERSCFTATIVQAEAGHSRDNGPPVPIVDKLNEEVLQESITK